MAHRAVIVIAAVLLVAACGSGGDGGGVASLEGTATTIAAPDPEVDAAEAEEALLAFTACLREQGIDIPDPQPDASGNLRLGTPGGILELADSLDREQIEQARDACAVHLEGISQQFDRSDMTAVEDALLDYATCMRENGYELPDPDLSAFLADGGTGRPDGPAGVFGGALDADDPAFRAANDECVRVFTTDRFAGG
jgi:hypothetical protein